MKIFHGTTDDGFNMAELLIVTAILTILALIAIPLLTGNRERAQNMRAKSPLNATASTVIFKRSVLTNDWSTDELNTSTELRDILMAAEPSLTFTAATDDGEPASAGPENVVVNRIGTITVGLQTKSYSGSYFCVLVIADSPLIYSRSKNSATCDGGSGGWSTDTPVGPPVGNGDRTLVCHKKGNDFMLLAVQNHSLSAHEAHGDINPVPAEGCP